MSFKKHIPDSITCCNLLSGCLGITFAIEGNLHAASYMIAMAVLFDFMDGLVARLLKTGTVIGKDLDSLADMVSFGVLPGVLMLQLMTHAIKEQPIADAYSWCIYSAFLIPLFSALRLAKFNNDARQSDTFIGLPTPANAIMIGSLSFIIPSEIIFSRADANLVQPVIISPFSLNTYNSTFSTPVLSNIYVLIAITVVMSFLLVAELPMIALKFRTFGWRDNKFRYLLLITCAALIIIFKFAGIPLAIVWYIILSILKSITEKSSQP